jgi:hypothetical protein
MSKRVWFQATEWERVVIARYRCPRGPRRYEVDYEYRAALLDRRREDVPFAGPWPSYREAVGAMPGVARDFGLTASPDWIGAPRDVWRPVAARAGVVMDGPKRYRVDHAPGPPKGFGPSGASPSGVVRDRFPFADLAPGQSFEVSRDEAPRARAKAHKFKAAHPGWYYVSRLEGPKTRRVVRLWRVT